LDQIKKVSSIFEEVLEKNRQGLKIEDKIKQNIWIADSYLVQRKYNFSEFHGLCVEQEFKENQYIHLN
jgi:hypothetical protein